MHPTYNQNKNIQQEKFMNFLPEDYESPKTSGHYMKLQDGENKIRVLTSPILGWEDWMDKKPIRFVFDKKPAKPLDPTKPIKHFWAFIVWNYNENQIQILHITQAQIRRGIEALAKDEDWGSPFSYDLKIIKKGKEKETEYMVNPLPHKPVSEEIIKAFLERPCRLEALYTNEDPFSSQWNSYTKAFFQLEQMGSLRIDEIMERIDKEDKFLVQNFIELMSKNYKKTQNQIVAEYSTVDKFLEDFENWKKANK